jgi:hypothetical protein
MTASSNEEGLVIVLDIEEEDFDVVAWDVKRVR